MTTDETTAYIAYGSGEAGLPQRILVVDDEPAVLFAYCKLIERQGIGVDISTSLQGALEHVLARPYLAVISDLRLAGTDNMDGLEVMRVTRQQRPDTTLICATGYGSCDLEQRVRELGASHYLEKPVPPATILQILKELKERAAAAVKQPSVSCSFLAMLWAVGN